MNSLGRSLALTISESLPAIGIDKTFLGCNSKKTA
jgi:hypothetical protein